MYRDIRVLVIESDGFARNWMALLLARDWRTTLFKDLGGVNELDIFEAKKLEKRDPNRKIDILLLDARLAVSKNMAQLFKNPLVAENHPKVICVGNSYEEPVLKLAIKEGLSGYILESEIHYSLAWAADLAMAGKWVITPSIQTQASQAHIPLPANCVLLDGRWQICHLSEEDANLARLALIFSMERHNLADELKVTENWGYGLVSALYKKMGLEEILKGEIKPDACFCSHPIILEHLDEMLSKLGKSHKARDMETLAYHLLTIPEISEIHATT